jgi:sarcosine oxidase
MHWFAPARDAALFTPERCPIAMMEYAPDRFFYTLPDGGAGLKAAIHHEGVASDPDRVERTVAADEVNRVRALLQRYLPAAAGALRRSATCLYTNTADHHFVIDAHPGHDAVVIVSACSGHGFKFASVVGEIVADLLGGRMPAFDLGPFALSRLVRPSNRS